MNHAQRFLVAYVATKSASQQAPDINPAGAALLGGLTGPIGSAIYGGAEGGMGTGARMAGRTLLEGTLGGLAGGIGGALVSKALRLPPAGAIRVGNKRNNVTFGHNLSLTGSRWGAALGSAHGAYASARNAKNRPTKKKTEKKAGTISPGAVGGLSALDPSGIAPAMYGGIAGRKGHPGLRIFGRSAAEGIGGTVAGAAGGAGLGAGSVAALAMLLSRGKIPAEELALKAGIGGGLGLAGGAMIGGEAGHIHGAMAAARNYNQRNNPSLTTRLMALMHKRASFLHRKKEHPMLKALGLAGGGAAAGAAAGSILGPVRRSTEFVYEGTPRFRELTKGSYSSSDWGALRNVQDKELVSELLSRLAGSTHIRL